MKIVLQRVRRAAVLVAGERIAEIGRGYLLLVGMEDEDRAEAVDKAASKIAGLRLFADDQGRMNLALDEVGGEVLVVSQFTLAASTARGRRPSLTQAMEPTAARAEIERFVDRLRDHGVAVQQGSFGETMQVELVNDGPVTLILEY